ncbi:MAG TPA: beta-ketoacyl synthase N-terminal-like domain-containing protein [Vicinamibacterales bacterium]|nr:beta-ketoacyl synthase N-terminal-like domain-containing protein [Vicinamibacterales bacterium]
MEPRTGRTTTAWPFIVSSLPGWPDVSVLRAAARAGATAVLNLEAMTASEVRASLAALTWNKPGRLGVRVDATGVLDPCRDLADAIDVVIVATRALADTIDSIDRLRAPSRELLLECTTADEARLGSELGVNGLIAKGHESGGRVGDETTFVLVQRLVAETTLPVYAHGGIGCHTIGACFVAGCAGAVLDVQLALARESALPGAVKKVLRRMGGDETVCLGGELADRYRVYRRPGFEAVDELQRLESELARTIAAEPNTHAEWQQAVGKRINWTGVGAPMWPLGQDATFARTLARRFRSVSGILSGLSEALSEHVTTAQQLRPLDRGAPLAVAHRTEYPILQGPMTRVSDTAPFADAVAKAGGLPFLAFALLRGPEVRSLLAATKELLADRSWGVGILGFVPNELREEQLRVIEEFRPPFALIAGGRPDQASKLEKHGIPTYLHVPAPSLLQMFLDDGARRFIFEGRECGGHVGPRTSFVLWESMVDTLIEAVERGVPASELHVVFAGGIHDARSAAMVATIGAPLAKLGARIGVLMGTAYLFTEEAVATGAIVEAFQEEAVKCSRTVLLESGPGHATRCADTPFFDLFRETHRRLVDQGEKPDDIRLKLEILNLGRLRVASKGIARASEGGREQTAYVSIDREVQRADGMYMIGQVAALRNATCSVADLHHAVSIDSTALLNGKVVASVTAQSELPAAASLSSKIAIVGAGCLLPHASDARTLWSNVFNKADAIGEIPPERFDATRYYDTDRRARDKIYSKWGGFLGEIPFDPLKYGIPPAAVPSIDPFQLLTLEVVYQALDDAGYGDRSFDRERTSVILGASGGGGDLGFRYGIRAGLPMYLDTVPEETLAQLPEWTEDSFAGVLLNVAAGRVANRLNLGGLNFTVDAACASSLAAVYVAARELESGASDMVIVGGIDTVNSPFGYLCFSSAQALSPTGRCRTFDDTADGIVISEGLVALVLKRVADAERDGDRIYAVIRSVAGSSDGRGKGLTAPRPEGQVRVLQRAYAAAGFSPATIGLVEAHGTGTVAGDTAEVTALARAFEAAGTPPGSCALGSIKSMIGHTKSAAGVSGLLKVALALHHKVLPPTLHVTRPNAKLREAGTPFFVNTEPLPWVASPDPEQPRRAAVSSFGFGGTNFHVVVEEYERSGPGALPEAAPTETWPSEVAYFTSPSPQHLLATLQQLEERLSRAPDVPLRSIAAAICRTASGSAPGAVRLAIVASSPRDLRSKLAALCEALKTGKTHVMEAAGLYLSGLREPVGKVAFLFPGQGSQYPGMLRDLSVHFPDLRHALEVADRVTSGQYSRRLSSYVLPPPAFSDDQADQQLRELTDTVVAQPALGAVEIGLCDLLRRLGVRPDMTAGHSYGEYVALSVAGAFPTDVLFAISAARGRAIKAAAGDHSGTMAAVSASPDAITRVLAQPADVWIANVNSPRQTVLAGRVDAIDAAVVALSAAGLAARRIPVACAFHTPLVQPAGRVMAELLARTDVHEPKIPVFSNTLAAPYPAEPGEIRRVLSEHISAPVRFAEQLDAMYREGARIFVEVGPRAVLSSLVRETLSVHGPVILSMDSQERHGVVQLLHVVAQLAVAGVPIDFEELWRGRAIESIQLADLAPAEPLPRHVWMVSGGRARRQDETRSKAPRQASASRQALAPVGALAAPTSNAVESSDEIPIPQDGLMQSDSPIPSPQFRVDTDSDDVMRQFQQLMSQFLQTQALVMTAYLQGAPAVGPSMLPSTLPAVASAAPRALTPRPAPPAGYSAAQFVTASPVAPPVAASAVHAVAAPSKPASQPAAVMVAAPAPAAAQPAAGVLQAGTSASDVLSQLLHIVSERTGYPLEMLDADANIEADLGIDSIKRMEILTAFQQMHAGARRGAFQGAMEKLTAIKGLRETASVLAELLAGQAEAAVA